MNHYTVYILLCADGSYFTGITNNFRLSMDVHHNGSNAKCYTCSRRPLQLVFIQEFDFILKAIQREKQIKSWPHKKKAAFVAGNHVFPEASAVNNDPQQ